MHVELDSMEARTAPRLQFCLTSLYMLQASLSYTGIGALVGVVVLLAGLPMLFLAPRR